MDVRVAGIVIEDDQILLLNQDTGTGRSWSLPGGKVEEGESLGGALIREMREETGTEAAHVGSGTNPLTPESAFGPLKADLVLATTVRQRSKDLETNTGSHDHKRLGHTVRHDLRILGRSPYVATRERTPN